MNKIAVFAFLIVATNAHSASVLRNPQGEFMAYYLGRGGSGEIAVSGTGYNFTFRRRWQDTQSLMFPITNFVYASVDCTGPAYSTELDPGFVAPDRIHNPPHTTAQMYYVPQTAPVQYVQIRSRRNGDSCDAFEQGTIQVLPALPNDVGVTGIDGPVLPHPMTVTSASLFKDGFEVIASS